jgi:CRP-like cAMP-binding protein
MADATSMIRVRMSSPVISLKQYRSLSHAPLEPESHMPISVVEMRAAVPSLIDVGESAVEQIARASNVRSYSRNASLYRAGDAADGLYFILAGKVLVARDTASRSEMLHVETASGVLGEIPAFSGQPFPATATALEPTRCAHLPIVAIERLLREEPTFARFALRRMAVRAQSLLRRIDELTASTVNARLASYVADRAAQSSTPEFTLGITQAELANQLGTAREVVVRGLAALIDAGAIGRVGRSRFQVRRLSTLRAIAGA